MNVTISFRHIHHSKRLDEKIREKSKKIGKFLEGRINIKWECHYTEGVYYAEASIFGPKFEYYAHADSDNIMKTLELVYQKLHRQMKKQKDRWRNRIHNRSRRPEILDHEHAWAEYDGDDEVTDKAS